jgi:hypothetical protein
MVRMNMMAMNAVLMNMTAASKVPKKKQDRRCGHETSVRTPHRG